jgi:hypothetical protein
MATYHCSVKHGSKGNGASSAAKADYICREGKYEDKPDLEYKESGNMPEWAQASPRVFWHVGDQCERANGRVYTEIEVALPREITPEQRRELVEKFIQEQIGHNHPYTVAIHTPKATLDGGDQPHAHIIFSERKLDGIERSEEQFFKRANAKEPEKGGTAKDRTWNEREKVQQIRESWEEHYNRHSPEQVSCRSLKEQGIDREPERHLGPKMARPDAPEAGKVMETREDLKRLEEIKREMAALSREIATQNIVVAEKPKKTRPAPTAERKNTKKQDISRTPERTRPADPNELASRSRNTTSSEREKAKETTKLDQVKPPPKVQAVTVKISELLNEAWDYQSRTHRRDAVQENELSDLRDSLTRPYYKESVEQYVTQKYKSKWDDLNETTKDYSERVTAYNEASENAGWFARNFKDFKTPALKLKKERQEIITRQTELEEKKASDKQKLLGSNYVQERYEVNRLAEKLHQERDPQGYANTHAAIRTMEDRITTERQTNQSERDGVEQLRRNLGNFSNSDQNNKYIELTFPVDQAGKRLTLEQALSNPATREITGKVMNSLNQSLDLYHKEHEHGIER